MRYLISQGVRPFNIPRILWRPEEIDLKNPALAVILHGFQRTQIDVHFITHAKINRPVMTIRSQRTVEKSLTAAKTSEGHRGP